MSPEQIKASLEFLKRQMAGTKPRVLVVEDDRDDEYLLVRQLARFNVDVVVARTGEEAQRLMSANGINIVFLDLKLPLVPGIEVIKQRRGLDPKTHFIAVTGSKDLAAIDEALHEGAVTVLHKPVTYETLEKIFDTKVT